LNSNPIGITGIQFAFKDKPPSTGPQIPDRELNYLCMPHDHIVSTRSSD